MIARVVGVLSLYSLLRHLGGAPRRPDSVYFGIADSLTHLLYFNRLVSQMKTIRLLRFWGAVKVCLTVSAFPSTHISFIGTKAK